MKASYATQILLSLCVVSVSAIASEQLDATQNATVDDDHAYEPVQHTTKDTSTPQDNEWKITGDIRAGYVNYDYSNSPYNFDASINKGHKNSKGVYVIPKISITSPFYDGFYAKVTGAGVTDFGLNDSLYETRTFAFGADGSSYGILQEAYVAYKKEGHKVLVGAEELSTPMVDSDDWYLLANTFQVAYYANKTIENVLLAGGYFYKMAGVWDSGADGASYHSMADASFVDVRDKANATDGGIYTGVFQYSDEVHNLQLWEYYAPDLYNTFFAQYDYTQKIESVKYDAGIQLIDFQEVGALASNNFTQIDYSIMSLRLDGKLDNGFDFSTGASFFTDGEGTGATLGAWGGYPYFANGMIFHFFEAGSLQNANSYKAQLGYDFSKLGLGNLWGGVRYTYFDLDPRYSFSTTGLAQDAMELLGVRLSYTHISGAYVTATYENVSLDNEPSTDGFRLIGGYKF
jgi:hypothetical protein